MLAQKATEQWFHAVRLVVLPHPFTVHDAEPKRASCAKHALRLFEQFDVVPRTAGVTQ
jgi:hypothetical protein